MRHFIYRQIRRLTIVLPVVGAVGIGLYLVMSNPGPQKEPDVEKRRSVRVIDVPVVDLVPRAAGFGTAEPARVWEAVAQVKGSIVQVHPHLEAGETIEAGSTLLRIDPSEYRLAVARLEANIDETKARLQELTQEKGNTEQLLAVEKRSLELAHKSLERQRILLGKDAVAPDLVDREERNFLQQKEKVQQLDNALSLIPARKKMLEATLAAQRSEMEGAKIDLARTTVRAPFNCRISDVSIERDQFVRAGQSLFEVHGTGSTEIEVRFRLDKLRRLVGEKKRERFLPGMGAETFNKLFKNVKATVRLKEDENWSPQWQARVRRLRETVDRATREMKVVVVVENPYQKAVPGVRPPLIGGMFCQVTLRAPARPGSIVLPRSAVHDRIVYVVDEDERLRKREIEVAFAQGDFVVVQSGLEAGTRIIVSDVTPAIEGVRVESETDVQLRRHLVEISQGGGDEE